MSDIYEYKDDELVNVHEAPKKSKAYLSSDTPSVAKVREKDLEEEGWGITTAMEANRNARVTEEVEGQKGSFGLGAQYNTPLYRQTQSEQSQNQIIYEQEKEAKRRKAQYAKEDAAMRNPIQGDAELSLIRNKAISPVSYLSADEYWKHFVGDPDLVGNETAGARPSDVAARNEKIARDNRLRSNLLQPLSEQDAGELDSLGMHVRGIKTAYDDSAHALSVIGENYDDNEFRSALFQKWLASQGTDTEKYMKEHGLLDNIKYDKEKFEAHYANVKSLLERQFEHSGKALEFVQSGQPYQLDPDYRKALDGIKNTRGTTNAVYSAVNDYRDIQTFGSLEKAKEYKAVDPNLALKYKNAKPEERKIIESQLQELSALRQEFGRDLYQLDKDKYNEFRGKLLDGTLTDEYKKEFLDHMKAKAEVTPEEKQEKKDKSAQYVKSLLERAKLAGPVTGFGEGFLKANDVFATGAGSGAATITSGKSDRVAELMRQARSVGSDALYRRWEDALIARGMDPMTTASRFNYLPRESLKQYKHGGVITKDGPIYAHGGEVILPQGFQDGGTVGNPATMALNSTVSIDTSELESVLSNFISSVGSALEGQTVSVEKPDWSVPVQMPEEGVRVEIDVTEASSSLAQAISSALSTPIKVDSSGVQAVGGEKLDKLGDALQNVQDRLTTVKTELEGKIQMLNTGSTDSLDIDRKVTSLINQRVTQMQEESQQSKQVAYATNSEVARVKQELNVRLDQLLQKINQTMSFTGVNYR
jgi:hypothetical protein